MNLSTSIEVEIDGEWTEFEFDIEFNAESFVPAKLSGHPDTWCPAEGGEIEVLEVVCSTTGITFDADDFVFMKNWQLVLDGATASYTESQLEEECLEAASDYDPY